MMHHGEAEKPGGMTAQDGPIERDEQKARADERREECDDAEIPKLIGIEASDARGAQE